MDSGFRTKRPARVGDRGGLEASRKDRSGSYTPVCRQVHEHRAVRVAAIMSGAKSVIETGM